MGAAHTVMTIQSTLLRRALAENPGDAYLSSLLVLEGAVHQDVAHQDKGHSSAVLSPEAEERLAETFADLPAFNRLGGGEA